MTIEKVKSCLSYNHKHKPFDYAAYFHAQQFGGSSIAKEITMKILRHKTIKLIEKPTQQIRLKSQVEDIVVEHH